jgi:regulatory protein
MADSDLYKSALSKAMALCSRHEYCIDDIRTKLTAWGVNENESTRIINSLVKDKFLDEKRYAGYFVRDKFKFNRWGRIKIAAHLKSKKITSEAIKEALDSIDNEQYTLVLKNLLSEHRRHIKAKNQFDLKGKLLRYGQSKGFESSLLYDLLNDFE